MFKIKFFVFGLSLIIIGISSFIFGLKDINEDRKLNSFGKTAEVIHIEKVKIPGAPDSNSADVYFNNENGEEQSTRLPVPPEIQHKIDIHEKVSIDYLPGKLSVCRWAGGPHGPGSGVAAILTGVVSFVLGLLLLRFLRR